MTAPSKAVDEAAVAGASFGGAAASPPEAPAASPPEAPAASPPEAPAPQSSPDGARPGFATVLEAGAQPTHGTARLVAILKDGTDGRVYPLDRPSIDIGSREGDVLLADDPYLSSRHARLVEKGGSWALIDLDSVNGCYLRIRQPQDIQSGDMILIGQQVMRFEVLGDPELPLGPASERGVLVFGTPEVPRIARLLQYTTEGVGRDVHYLYRDETVLGRENGDIVFTDDPFLSRRHAAISIDRASNRFVLKDLGSSNGTSLRFRGEQMLTAGDQFRMGRHLFRFDARSDGGQGG